MEKSTKYTETLAKVHGVLSGETDFVANMANVAAILKSDFDFWWVGFYLIKNNQLVLGPFQGPVACTRIDFGKGVCGSSWKRKETIIVADVHLFEGHIACSEYSNSEIVIPLKKHNEMIGILDIDSTKFNNFDEVDAAFLEKMMNLLTESSTINNPIAEE